MIGVVRRTGTALAPMVLALVSPASASAECLGCDQPATSPADALLAVALFAVIAGLGVIVAVAEARGRR